MLIGVPCTAATYVLAQWLLLVLEEKIRIVAANKHNAYFLIIYAGPTATNLFLKSVQALLKDESFSGLKTEPSKQAQQTAEQLLARIPANKIKAFQFELKLVANFCVSCLQSTAKSQKKCRENMC